VTGIEAANAWLPGFVADYNGRFGRVPASSKDLHRPLSARDDLDEALAWRETRTVTANLTLHYDRMMLLLDPTPQARGLARKQVEVVNYPDGRFAVRHAGTDLPFRVFDKIATLAPGTVVESKRLGEALAYVREQQAAYPVNQRRGAPGRARPPNNLEAPGVPARKRGSDSAASTLHAP
jgi:hypothetical protein